MGGVKSNCANIAIITICETCGNADSSGKFDLGLEEYYENTWIAVFI